MVYAESGWAGDKATMNSSRGMLVLHGIHLEWFVSHFKNVLAVSARRRGELGCKNTRCGPRALPRGNAPRCVGHHIVAEFGRRTRTLPPSRRSRGARSSGAQADGGVEQSCCAREPLVFRMSGADMTEHEAGISA